jgi:hypothetical protein
MLFSKTITAGVLQPARKFWQTLIHRDYSKQEGSVKLHNDARWPVELSESILVFRKSDEDLFYRITTDAATTANAGFVVMVTYTLIFFLPTFTFNR